MMKKNSRVAQLMGTEYPVIQAAMNWLTSAELVAAVSEAGGCGLLGPNAGQAVMTSDVNETIERMRREVRKTASLTSKPFGLAIVAPTGAGLFAEGFLQIALTEPAVKVVLVNGTVPKSYIDSLHDAGKVVFRKMITDSIAEFKKAEEIGYDAVVATGCDCGGHTSDHVKIGTLTMIRIAKEAVNIPVIAAGGMIDGETVAVAGMLGAEGIYSGTRFVVSKEGPAAENVKKRMCEITTDDLIEYNGIWGSIRSLPTPMACKCKELYEESHAAHKKEITSLYQPLYKISMLEGDIEAGSIDCGASIGQIKEVLSCEEIMKSFAGGMEE